MRILIENSNCIITQVLISIYLSKLVAKIMERWQNRVAVVTGASSGIGKAIANDLIKAGMKVVAVGRRLERLEKNRSQLPKNLQDFYYPRKLDITNETEVKKTFSWIEETLGGTDILVNNAGILRFGKLLDMNSREFNDVIDTNVKGLIYATQAAFKSMNDRNIDDGHILHINSWLGHHVIGDPSCANLNVYSASKFAVTAINETLRNELRSIGSKIKTTSISPGGVRTEILPKEAYENNSTVLEAEDVSQAVLFAISTPKHVQVLELIIKAVGEPI
ncbi:farnesol dehydrogenase-like [Episyrphus balteatus]|uniref:farnesol dehydrogenase-like n=1 Tax=Episyrphus balteatus TaxID=286459 RepID=UPI0024855E6D|nr:farnesol dehydrogenase-like [Episyrphus balteatus]